MRAKPLKITRHHLLPMRAGEELRVCDVSRGEAVRIRTMCYYYSDDKRSFNVRYSGAERMLTVTCEEVVTA